MDQKLPFSLKLAARIIRVSFFCFCTLAVSCKPPAPTPQPTPTPIPPPAPGELGTIEFWQDELKGKSKSEIKAEYGAPFKVENQGSVYIYKKKFFHPDLDQWRDLRITFSTKSDELALLFTGAGGDTKSYSVDLPALPDFAGPGSTAPSNVSSSQPLPSGTTDSTANLSNADSSSGKAGRPAAKETAHVMEEVRNRLLATVATIKFTEPYVGTGTGPLIDEGQGATGVLVEYKNKKYLLTNSHVLEAEARLEIGEAWNNGPRSSSGSRVADKSRVRVGLFEQFLTVVARFPLPEAKTSDGTPIKLLPGLLLSRTRDIALIPAETSAPALLLSESSPNPRTSVIVAGNSDGAHTILLTEGSISQLGPDRFDVTISQKDSLGNPQEARLQSGMSGSPVVDLQSGRVAGVISYTVTRPDTWIEDSIVNSPQGPRVISHYKINVSNIAYRLDNLDDLQSVTWPQFLIDYTTYWAMRERAFNVEIASEAVQATIKGQTRQELSPDFDSAVQALYSSFCRDIPRILGSSDPKYMMDSWNNYQRSLEQLLRNPMEDRIATDYIRTRLAPIATKTTARLTEKLRQAGGKVSTLANKKKTN